MGRKRNFSKYQILYDWIVKYSTKYQRVPTYRVIVKAGLRSSISEVCYAYRTLEKLGLLSKVSDGISTFYIITNAKLIITTGEPGV